MRDNTRTAPGAKEAVTRDVERESYDLSHFSMNCGYIGGLQTLSLIPVIAGDSFSVDVSAVFRLAPLRKNLYLDFMIDLFAFNIPHRHIYGQDWIDFIKGGVDESITFSGDTMATDASLQCVGSATAAAATLPRWMTRGYMQIWNRYFKDPTDANGDKAENYFTTLTAGDERLIYGLPCAYMKRIWNTAIVSNLTTADYRLPLESSEVNLLSMAALQGRLKSEQNRDWFGVRYKDILEQSWNASVNIDADKRPELIMRSSTWASGYDVDGTADANLGLYAGKGQGVATLKFPSKFFPEHGALWIMALVRFPAVHYLECHYLNQKVDPTYAQIAGDADLYSRLASEPLLTSDIFVSGNSTSLGRVPYGQWFREHYSFVHPRYVIDAGHPFLDDLPASRDEAIYHTTSTYDNVFQTLSMKHWNAQAFIGINAKRYVPDPVKSIMAGTGSPGGV